jgi:hypothetical protein
MTRARHDQFVWRKADQIVTAMQIRGLALHLQDRWYGAHWWLNDGTHLDSEIAEAVVKDARIVAVGDSLLPDHARGQTWRYAPVWSGR